MLNNWVFHDSFPTSDAALKFGETAVAFNLVKGVKIIEKGKESRPFLLFILPFTKN